MFVDENYVPTLGMKMVKGRNFEPASFPTDSSGILVNEAAVALLGWKDPIGQILYRPAGQESSGKFTSKPFHVVGVIKDFNYNSMHQKVLPAVLDLSDSRGILAIRLQGGNIPSLVHQVQKKWDAIADGVPFTYSFMDNDFNNLYHAEEQTGQVFITFAIFAIVIACLGLFGLVTYAAEQRTKEIGIRKVLGSSIGSIVALLSRDFVRLVLIASVIAFPVSWWGMHTWLQSFAYRIDISWWIFAVAGLVAIAIALITVSFQTIRAALANPVRSLRSQ
jgi:putative ABC transport system permease protein